jgi:hypothetical protein
MDNIGQPRKRGHRANVRRCLSVFQWARPVELRGERGYVPSASKPRELNGKPTHTRSGKLSRASLIELWNCALRVITFKSLRPCSQIVWWMKPLPNRLKLRLALFC